MCSPFFGLPPFSAHFESMVFGYFFARASPPNLAHSRRSSALVFLARLLPPSLPSCTAWGFFIYLSYLAKSKFAREKEPVTIQERLGFREPKSGRIPIRLPQLLSIGMPRGRWFVLQFPWDAPVDPSRPVVHALARVGANHWDAALNTVIKAGAKLNRPPAERLTEAEAVEMLQSASAHMKSAGEILRWIVPPKPPLAPEEAAKAVQQFSELGQDWIDQLASKLQKLPAHRPSKRRQSHIAAFEFMLGSKKNSLGQAVLSFCPCGGSHDRKCHANLKRGIHDLKRVLRRYAPELVDQYDALHPDRHTKRHI